ncbi:MAG: hypothetical protein KAW47_05770 [Thermoplasmatales archaeon]|nr:hypothetical protein [Thermoplasmatales archaeon]
MRKDRLPVEKVCINAKNISKFIMSKPHETKLSESISFLKWVKKRTPNKLKQSLKRTIHSSPSGYRHSNMDTRAYLKEILACPECKVKVYFKKDKMLCLKCGKQFNVENNIAFMLLK